MPPITSPPHLQLQNLSSQQGRKPSRPRHWALWLYPPSGENSWEEPILLWHHANGAEIHRQARLLRQNWPGHLVAVTTGGRVPKRTR